MKLRNVSGLLLSLVTLIMVGCGGGGGGGGTTVSGVASAGPVRNGHLAVFEIISSHDPLKAHKSATPLSGLDNVATDASGKFSFGIPGTLKSGGLMIEVKDGVFKDEATGLDKQVETEYPGHMRAAFGNISGVVRRGETLKISVTPFTELAVRRAGTALDDNSTRASQVEIEHAFGLDDNGVDIIHTEPFDATQPPPAGATDDRKVYSHALAVVSQFQKDDTSGKTLSGISDDLVAELEANNGTFLQATDDKFTRSELNLANSGDDLTGVTPSTPATIVVTAATATSAKTAPVQIDATVQVGGVNVPDGTEVKFTVKSGTATVAELGDNGAGAATKSALTVGGVASVNLKTTIAGAAVVTATAGGVSADSPTVTFIDQPTLATVKIQTTGTLAAGVKIGGANFIVSQAIGLTIADADVTATGTATGSLAQPNTTAPANVNVALISTGGFTGVGEIATLVFHVPVGTFPTAADFSVALTGAGIIDTNGATLSPGIGVSILSVTVQ